jgi:hypothetical protein
MEIVAKATYGVIPAKPFPAFFKPGAGIPNPVEILDSGSRFACPE